MDIPVYAGMYIHQYTQVRIYTKEKCATTLCLSKLLPDLHKYQADNPVISQLSDELQSGLFPQGCKWHHHKQYKQIWSQLRTSEWRHSLQTVHTWTTLRQTHSTHQGRPTQSATPLQCHDVHKQNMLDQTKQPWRYVKLAIGWGCWMTSTSTIVNVWHANHLNFQHHRKFHSPIYQLGSHGGRWLLWTS